MPVDRRFDFRLPEGGVELRLTIDRAVHHAERHVDPVRIAVGLAAERVPQRPQKALRPCAEDTERTRSVAPLSIVS